MNVESYLILALGMLTGSSTSTILKLIMLAITVLCLATLYWLKRQHETLRQSQMRLQSLLDSMQDLVFIIDRGKVLREFYQYRSDKLYIPPEKFIGKHLCEIGYPDEVYNVLNEAYDKTLATGEMSLATYQLPTPAGLCWFEMNVAPIYDANGTIQSLVGVARDITKRKDAERALAENQFLLKELIDSIPIPFFFKDPEGKYIILNQAFGTFFNSDASSLIGHSMFDLMPEREANDHHARDRTLLLGSGNQVYEYKQTDGSGRQRDTIIHRSVITGADGKLIGIVGAIIDISEQKQAERDRMELQTRIMQTGKLEAIGQLAAGIAHEINNPIQFVGDNIKFVQDSIQRILLAMRSLQQHTRIPPSAGAAPNPESKRIEQILAELDVDFLDAELPSAMADMQEGMRRVSKIVSALRDFSHPDDKDKKWTDLNFNIKSTITITRSAWSRVAKLEMELAPNLPLIRCHSGAINQVFTNLIINAADAIAESGRSDYAGRIIIRTHFDETKVYIEVEDDGGGIPGDIQYRIFDPFFTTKDIGKGTGQGLYISRNIVMKDHGGDISFTTKPGTGTVFKVTLPREAT